MARFWTEMTVSFVIMQAPGYNADFPVQERADDPKGILGACNVPD